MTTFSVINYKKKIWSYFLNIFIFYPNIFLIITLCCCFIGFQNKRDVMKRWTTDCPPMYLHVAALKWRCELQFVKCDSRGQCELRVELRVSWIDSPFKAAGRDPLSCVIWSVTLKGSNLCLTFSSPVHILRIKGVY